MMLGILAFALLFTAIMNYILIIHFFDRQPDERSSRA